LDDENDLIAAADVDALRLSVVRRPQTLITHTQTFLYRAASVK